jgi:hypothetical protein
VIPLQTLVNIQEGVVTEQHVMDPDNCCFSRRPDFVPRVVHMDHLYGAVTFRIVTSSGLVFVSLTLVITFINFS